ncbi:MAG: substrate-binding domain-containing protein [Candidatus Cybelea sp.]
MRKTLAILAWAAIPALLMSACNGNSGGNSGLTSLPNAPAASQHGRIHHNDNGTGDIHAGGATFPAYGYNLGDQPVGVYTDVQATPGPGSLLFNAAQKNADGNNYYYCLTGSGYGRKEFEGVQDVGTQPCAVLGASPTGFGGRTDPIDFVGSDVAMPSSECCASGTAYATSYASTYGQPFEFPTYGGPIVFPYIDEGGNGLTGLGGNQLKLSTWTYCAIANGTIGYWDDGAITKDNGGTEVAGHQPIYFYYRTDGSGTTYLFENKLSNSAKGCNQTFRGQYAKAPYGSPSRSAAWTFPPVSLTALAWTGPTGTQTSGSVFAGASGNPGILQCIQGGSCGTAGFPYGTGYAEGAWAAAATSPSVGQAALLSGSTFVSPTNANAVAEALKGAAASKIQFGEGADGVSLGSSTPGCQLYMPPSAFVNPPTGAYPMVGLSYFLFYGKDQTRAGSNHFNDLKSLIVYLDSNAWNNALPSLEYTPLPASTQKKIQKALVGTHAIPACLQT